MAKAVLGIVVLAVLVATAANAITGRYPVTGIGRTSSGASAVTSSSSSSSDVWDSLVFDSGVWG